MWTDYEIAVDDEGIMIGIIGEEIVSWGFATLVQEWFFLPKQLADDDARGGRREEKRRDECHILSISRILGYKLFRDTSTKNHVWV